MMTALGSTISLGQLASALALECTLNKQFAMYFIIRNQLLLLDVINLFDSTEGMPHNPRRSKYKNQTGIICFYQNQHTRSTIIHSTADR